MSALSALYALSTRLCLVILTLHEADAPKSTFVGVRLLPLAGCRLTRTVAFHSSHCYIV